MMGPRTEPDRPAAAQEDDMDTAPRLWAIWSNDDPGHLIGTRHTEAEADRTARAWGGYVEALFSKDADR